VCIDPSLDAQPVQRFASFTEDVDRLVDWLLERGVTTVAMEATGIYWRTLFLKLSAVGIEGVLVDPRQTRNPRGRKTDMQDCQWIWQLHAHGLLSGAFLPPEQMQAIRELLRLRAKRVREVGVALVEMQRALSAMNLQLQHVLSDVGGTTGLAIIDAIIGGERDPQALAKHRNYRCRSDEATITKALRGTWRDEFLFELQEARRDHRYFQESIATIDARLGAMLAALAPAPPADTTADADAAPATTTAGPRKRGTTRNEFSFDAQAVVAKILGVDLTSIDGIGPSSGLQFMGEIGFDISRFPTAQHFCSWLGLAPNPKKSGGKLLGHLPTTANRAAHILRNAAVGLDGKKGPLSEFFAKIARRRGRVIAISATAHRLARIIYAMIRDRTAFDRTKITRPVTEKTKTRMVENLKRRAAALGYDLIVAA
jgi:transposase